MGRDSRTRFDRRARARRVSRTGEPRIRDAMGQLAELVCEMDRGQLDAYTQAFIAAGKPTGRWSWKLKVARKVMRNR